MKRPVAVVAALLVLSACGSNEPTEPATGGISLTAATTTDDQSGSTGAKEPSGVTPTEATQVTTAGGAVVQPALGITVGAADSFDESFLQPGRGSQFVPMDNPTMVPASEVTWLDPDSVIMGIAHASGEAQAYPVAQMAYHHIANTTIAGEPFLVTY